MAAIIKAVTGLFTTDEVKVAAEKFELTPEMSTVIEHGREHSALVRNALDHEERFRAKTAEELDELLAGIKTLVDIKQDSGGADFDLKKLHEQVLTKIQTNKNLYAKATIELNRKPIDPNIRLYARINKMESALDEAGKLLNNFDNFQAFCEGRIPEEFEYHTKQKEYTYLGNQKGVWGNSKGTDLKAALTMIYLTFCHLDKVSDIELGTSIEKSAFRHQTKLPETFTALDGEEFRNFSFYKDGKLKTLHSGYAWGGCRFDLTEFGPRDCSQFIQELSSCNAIITTGDLLFSYTAQTNELSSRGKAYDDWLTGRSYPETVKTFEPVTDLNKIFGSQPFLDANYDCFYTVSRFDKEKDPKCEGNQASGHTAIVVGQMPSEDRMKTAPRLLTYGCNRDREKKKMEGYGLGILPYYDKLSPKADDPTVMEKTMLMSVRPKSRG